MNTDKITSVINYTLNKFCPIVVITFLTFLKMGLETWEPYVIVGLVLFAMNFHYKVGYSVAICEERGLLDDE
tara:strand:- start:1427 stop:1642 length:216 start_codon:yes stop_codon:yes gene_type:complete